MEGRARAAVLAAATLGLAACGTTYDTPAPPYEVHPTGTYKVGNPYTVNGVTYQPRVQPGYDETGVASWYGSEFHGRYTANGELFDMNKLSGAHRTLPMPSYVRVTNLENGRSLVLRINDRGPFAKDRILDVSRRAAQLLGFERSGTARVRVQAVSEKADAPRAAPPAPSDALVSAAAETEPAAGAITTTVLAPIATASVTPVETAPFGAPSPVSGLFIQLGAFGTPEKAEEIRNRASALGAVSIVPIMVGGRTLYRVRLGPYGSDQEAEGARAQISANGFPDAKIVND
jgi:peptidoglycan lytic transglycosylase